MPALQPPAARDAHRCKHVTGAVLRRLEAALRCREFIPGLSRRRITHPVKAARQPGPALCLDVAAGNRACAGLLGERDRLRGVAVLKSPRPARKTQRAARGRARVRCVHRGNCSQCNMGRSSRADPGIGLRQARCFGYRKIMDRRPSPAYPGTALHRRRKTAAARQQNGPASGSHGRRAGRPAVASIGSPPGGGVRLRPREASRQPV